MFLELGLPFILRFINDWRAGKTTVKEAVEKVKNVKNGIHDEKELTPAKSNEEAEERFLEKVERELGLLEYNLFSTCYYLLRSVLDSQRLDFSRSSHSRRRPMIRTL